MSEKMMCQKCLIPVLYCVNGWRHYPGPGRKVPAPGHRVVPVPREGLDRAVRNLGQSP